MSYHPDEPSDEQLEMLGKQVVVQNPRFKHARWKGKALGIAMDPSIIIEEPDGRRMTLPLAWARLVPPPTWDEQLDAAAARWVEEANAEFDKLELSITSRSIYGDRTAYHYMTRAKRAQLLDSMMTELDRLGE